MVHLRLIRFSYMECNSLFELPKKPSIELKDQREDARAYCVLPIRACYDKALTSTDFRMLCLLASYASNNGFTFVSTKTLATKRGTSRQSVSKQLKKLEAKGYVETVRKGFNGIRGALRRIIFDASLSIDDVVSISNTPIQTQTEEYKTMARRQAYTVKATPKEDALTPITFSDAILVVSQSLTSDSDLLRLERLVSQGITRSELIEAFNLS